MPVTGYYVASNRDKPVLRGTVAQAIASLSLGNNATFDQAFQFLFHYNITTGQNPGFKEWSTLQYFGAYNQLTRSQAVVFLYRIHELIEGGNERVALKTKPSSSDYATLVSKANDKLDKRLLLNTTEQEKQFSMEHRLPMMGNTDIIYNLFDMPIKRCTI